MARYQGPPTRREAQLVKQLLTNRPATETQKILKTRAEQVFPLFNNIIGDVRKILETTTPTLRGEAVRKYFSEKITAAGLKKSAEEPGASEEFKKQAEIFERISQQTSDPFKILKEVIRARGFEQARVIRGSQEFKAQKELIEEQEEAIETTDQFSGALSKAWKTLEKIPNLGPVFQSIRGIGRESLISALQSSRGMERGAAEKFVDRSGVAAAKVSGISGIAEGFLTGGLGTAALAVGGATAGYLANTIREMSSEQNLRKMYRMRGLASAAGARTEGEAERFATPSGGVSLDQHLDIMQSAINMGMTGTKFTRTLESINKDFIAFGLDITNISKTMQGAAFGFDPTEVATGMIDDIKKEVGHGLLATQVTQTMADVFKTLGTRTFGFTEEALKKTTHGLEKEATKLHGAYGERGRAILEGSMEAQMRASGDIRRGYMMAALTGLSPGQAMGQMALGGIRPGQINNQAFGYLAQTYMQTFGGPAGGLTRLAQDMPELFAKIAEFAEHSGLLKSEAIKKLKAGHKTQEEIFNAIELNTQLSAKRLFDLSHLASVTRTSVANIETAVVNLLGGKSDQTDSRASEAASIARFASSAKENTDGKKILKAIKTTGNTPSPQFDVSVSGQ